MRGFGGRRWAISIRSRNVTRLSAMEVGEIVVGRVIVAVTEYEIVPRSN